MLADEVDAVIGGDTHRDSHALEMAAPNGGTIGTLAIGNDETGYADAIAWITQNSPGPRVIVGLEGTRSYGVGLTRALQAAGFLVLEVEQPRRADRRRGKSDPIDAHLAALQVLRMPADRKALPRSDGDREALRILLIARREMTTVKTQQINRLRALLRRRRHRPPGGPRRSHHRQPHPAGPSPTAARRHHGTGRAPRRDPQTHPRRP